MRSGSYAENSGQALLDAFRKAYEMEIVVSDAEIGTTFANFMAVPGTPYEAGPFNLLDYVEAQNKLVPFLQAARLRNPGNENLRKVLAELSVLEPRFAALRPDTSLCEAERIVLRVLSFEDAAVWISTLAKMRHAVCRVEPQPATESIDGYGTGYLVAPDVVMTNYHVAEGFWNDKTKASCVVLRFDFEKAVTGASVSDGTAFKLAATLRGPAGPSAADRDPAVAGALDSHFGFGLRTAPSGPASRLRLDRGRPAWFPKTDRPELQPNRPDPDPPAPECRPAQAFFRGCGGARSA